MPVIFLFSLIHSFKKDHIQILNPGKINSIDRALGTIHLKSLPVTNLILVLLLNLLHAQFCTINLKQEHTVISLRSIKQLKINHHRELRENDHPQEGSAMLSKFWVKNTTQWVSTIQWEKSFHLLQRNLHV